MLPLRVATGFLLSILLAWTAASAKVEVSGVRGKLRDNVMAHLTLAEAGCDAPSWRVRRLTRKADPEIREALEAYGYYNPVLAIGSGVESGCWLVNIHIEPGEPVRLRKVDVAVTGEAAGDPGFRRLLKTQPLQPGDQLDHADYERFKKALGDLARQRGYFAAAFPESRIDVYTRENAADIVLHYDSGPRYHFGPVTFQQEVVRPDLVERFVDFRPGDPYDGTKVGDFYNALLATGYFSSVDLRTSPRPPPDLEVPVSVALTAARRQLYTLGTGYSTDKGVKFRAGYTNRRLNESGHQFDSSMDLSKVESIVGVSYRLPRKDPRVEWLSIDAGFKYEDTASKRADTYKIGLKEYRRRPADWIETRFIDASVEDYTIAAEESREFLLIPGLSWTHKFPDSPAITRPDKGHRVSFKVSGTTELIGSDAEFLQADLYGKVIVPVWPGGRLLLRAEAGATLKDNFSTLPASVRYFVGGDYSVRGYDYESLGPTDDQGLVVGGSHKLVGSMEVDQRVWGNWSLAAFVDSGNAFDDFSGLTLKTGVGGGLRWYSPLGPVRVDIAFPLDKDAPDSWRLHVTLGPDL